MDVDINADLSLHLQVLLHDREQMQHVQRLCFAARHACLLLLCVLSGPVNVHSPFLPGREGYFSSQHPKVCLPCRSNPHGLTVD